MSGPAVGGPALGSSAVSGASARARRPRALWGLAGVTLLVAASALALADDQQPAQAAGKTVTQSRTLDLSPPPLRLVLTPKQIHDLTTDQDDDTPIEDVTIRQDAYEEPIPVGPFRALPWALLHPLQAWKILMPVPGD